jgi:hypothetical protein
VLFVARIRLASFMAGNAISGSAQAKPARSAILVLNVLDFESSLEGGHDVAGLLMSGPTLHNWKSSQTALGLLSGGYHMAKLIIIAVFLVSATVGAPAFGQNDNRLVAPEIATPEPGHLAIQDYLTSTGATVPRPGVPQASGPTPLDHAIEQRDNQIDSSICKGC